MDKQTFEHEMNRAKTMQGVEPERQDYWIGYQRGLRRAYHGDNFGTDREHRQWLVAGIDSVDESRKQRGLGYRDGLKMGGIETATQIKYLLSVDEEIWRKVQHICIDRRITIKDYLLQLILQDVSKS